MYLELCSVFAFFWSVAHIDKRGAECTDSRVYRTTFSDSDTAFASQEVIYSCRPIQQPIDEIRTVEPGFSFRPNIATGLKMLTCMDRVWKSMVVTEPEVVEYEILIHCSSLSPCFFLNICVLFCLIDHLGFISMRQFRSHSISLLKYQTGEADPWICTNTDLSLWA